MTAEQDLTGRVDATEQGITPEEQETDRQIAAFVEGFAARFIKTPPELGETASVEKELTAPAVDDPSRTVKYGQIHVDQKRLLDGGLRTYIYANLFIFAYGRRRNVWISGRTPHANQNLDDVLPLPYPASSPVIRPYIKYGSTFAGIDSGDNAKGLTLLKRDVKSGFLNNFRFGSDIVEALTNAVKPPASS